MAYVFKNARKEDLANLLTELGETVNQDDTRTQLKTKIEDSQAYKDDFESVAELLNSIVEERKNKAVYEVQKVEVERLKLAQLEKQLEIEKLKLQNQNVTIPVSNNTEINTKPFNDIEKLLKSVRALTIPVPEKAENFNLFFQTLERSFIVKNVPEEMKAEILVNLLGEKLNHLLYYISEEDLKSYEKVKNLVLKEYQPTPQECLLNFKKAAREHKETYVQFASRLNALFRYYLKLREVQDFESLCDLMVSDKLYQTLDREIASHVCVKQGDCWFRPTQLAKECDIYAINKGKNVKEIYSPIREKFSEKRGKIPNRFSKESQDRKLASKPGEKKIICFVCNGPHFARNCSQRFGKKNTIEESSPRNDSAKISTITHDLIAENPPACVPTLSELQYVDVLIDGNLYSALHDSGATLLAIKRSAVRSPKEVLSQITLTSCFGESQTAELAKFYVALPDKQPKEMIAAICNELQHDLIIPSSLYESLKEQTEHKLSLLSPSDSNEESGSAEHSSDKGEFTERGKNDLFLDSSLHDKNGFKRFLLNMCDAVEDNSPELRHITDLNIRKEVEGLIKNYKPCKTDSTDLKLNIVLKDEIPVCQRPRRLAFSEKKEVENQMREWLDAGIIRESTSEYSSPVVVCRKRDNSIRTTIDFRKLNQKVIRDRYPLPIMEEILDKLGNAEVFTSLDLKNAFFHVDIEEKCKKYTSFVTDTGQYEFNKVPFGLSSSPIMFQRYINTVFKNLLKDGTLIIYLDDIIIPANNEQEALIKLQRVLQTASRFGLELNMAKCQFLKRRIEFLGHIIQKGTIQPSPAKTAAVKNFPEPRSTKEVQSFLGLTGYFRKYIASYAKIARPLSDLLRDSVPFKFGPEQKLAFEKLKDILTKAPLLHLYKQGRKLELHTDASSLGLGAVLFQENDDGKYHPIYYWSRKTSVLEEKYCSYELEILAVVEALKKFRNYLLGTKFKIFTDCLAFTKTLGKKELSPKLARWHLFLQEFDYELIHRPATQMKHVDALSRYPIASLVCDELTHRIIAAQENDEYIKTLKTLLQNNETNEFTLKNNVLFKIIDDAEVLVVPETMQMEIVKSCHALGHFSVNKTEDLVRRDYFFPNLKKCVEAVVSSCIECILVNKKRGKAEGFLNPIPKEDKPLLTYHVDFLGPLPSTNKNYNHIFSVIDSFSKFAWLYPVKSTTAQDALQRLKQQQTIFGNPKRLISDRGPAFTSNEFKQYCENEGIEHIPITAGVPRGNGQIERLHATIIPVLSKLSIDDPTKWYKHVDSVQRIINATSSNSTGRTPFEIMTGLKMRHKEEKQILEVLNEEFENSRIKELESIREEAKQKILEIQEKNRKSYNKKRKQPHVYKVGDLVAIQRTQFGSGLKLRLKFFGPYKVIKVKSHDRYDVEKVGNHEGPRTTSTAVDYMKPWQ